MHVAYPNVGTYSLPGMWINGVHHSFGDQKISVESFSARNLQYYLLILTIFSIISLAVEIRSSIKDIRSLAREFKSRKEDLSDTGKEDLFDKKSQIVEKLKHIGAYLISLLIIIIFATILLGRNQL